MIVIVITGRPVGRAKLYSKKNRQGLRKFVPAFKAFAVNTVSRKRFTFAVTRSSSEVEFEGLNDRFGVDGECPPSTKKPYRAKTYTHHSGTFALKLYEQEDPDRERLKGISTVTRSHIMLHIGPGRSLGCMMIAGGKKAHARFTKVIKDFLDETSEIIVAVKPITRLPRPT
jgi:hypothetical protein